MTEASPDSTASAPGGRVLVFGASGYVGSNLVPRLAAEGLTVRAAARNRKVLEARGWSGVELAEADALDPATLPAALTGVAVAYYLVHSMAAGSRFGRLDLEAAENFARAAAEAGVRRIVYLGGLVPEDADSEHIVSRRDTGEVLRRGTVPVTEMRAGIIVGPGSAAFEVMRDLVLHLPLMVTPRWVRAKSPPIALENLLEYLVRVAFLPQAANHIYDAAGPETLTYEDMMRELADVAGKRRPTIVPVPVLTPKLSSYWLGLITAVPASIARALIGGLKHDFGADDEALRKLVPQRLLTFRESVGAAFAAERAHTVAARWTEGAFALRGFSHDVAFYAKKASGTAIANASPAAVWRQVTAIGGDNRYYYMNILWTIRELMDWCVGGPGFSRGRRDPVEVRLGDVIDYWTVIGIEPERRLTLHFGMKAPGAGVLEFELEPVAAQRTRVTVTAYWHPKGFWGLAYWYALVPAHLFIFKGWTAEIARRAEEAGPESSRAPPSPTR
ncbi:MAG TPA: SDR family oxidoreductase [Pelomicrobium sp.]|nr:SDR family oxidoreductase [Pelomicrobium sp.]